MAKNLDGVDIMPFLTGQNDGVPHETFYWRQGAKTALRHGDWKLVNMRRDRGQPRWELYNIASDPSEEHDRAMEMATKVAELEGIWRRMDDEMIKPRF